MEYVIGKEYLHLGHHATLVYVDGDEATIKNRFEEHATVKLSSLTEKEARVGDVKKRLFVRCPGTDETWCHCGDTTAEATKAVGYMLESDIDLLFGGTDLSFSVDFEIRQMTDAEVAALPDL